MNWKNLDTLKSFKELKNQKKVDLKSVLSGDKGYDRVKKSSVNMAYGMKYNFSGKEVDNDILDTLQKLSDEADLISKYEALYNGEIINTGEKRRVLHHLTRGQLGKDVMVDSINKREFYEEQLNKIKDFSDKIHSGKILNEDNEKYETVVQIGIGGSDLGPRAIYIALKNFAIRNNKSLMDAYFVSNVDPDDIVAVLKSIDIKKTMFVLVSKSGTTLETLTNQAFVMEKIKEQGLDPAKHMVVATSETSPLAKSSDFLEAFFMDDYIGGRYSSTSVVGGVVLSLAYGTDVFEAFLEGAHEEDEISKNKNILENPSLLDALIGVYERNVLNYPSTAVLPYSQGLSRFPAHLQQLDMESNGKHVNRDGEDIDYVTGPLIFGEPGTNGQHSFYQLLHQGTDIIPLQFIGFKNSQFREDLSIEGSTSQEKLCANVVAQIVAFLLGQDNTNKNKQFNGNRPSSLIIGDDLNPRTLGALLSHFENKVMFQGFLWNINSFDQEGVQLGKTLAKKVLSGNISGVLKAYNEMFTK